MRVSPRAKTSIATVSFMSPVEESRGTDALYTRAGGIDVSHDHEFGGLEIFAFISGRTKTKGGERGGLFNINQPWLPHKNAPYCPPTYCTIPSWVSSTFYTILTH